MSRFPGWVYGHGAEPDPRFSLANERTFLAWIRTSLALLAAGVALEALDVPITPRLRLASAAIFVGLGMLATAQAWIGWMRTERALRENRALSGPSMGLIIATGVTMASALIVLGYTP